MFFKSFSTYLDVTFLHEEVPCRFVDMIKHSKEKHLLLKMSSAIIDPFFSLKDIKRKTSYTGGPKHDMWQKEKIPCLDDVI